MEFLSDSPARTEAVGVALGRVIPAGTVIAYRGGVGAVQTG